VSEEVGIRQSTRKEKTMKRSKVILVVLIALFAVSMIVTPALARRGDGRRGHSRGGLMPQFTAEQQEQIEAIHEKFNDECAELTNRAKVLALELKDLVSDGEPDFDGIEGKLEEMSRVRLDLMKLRIRIHKEVRPLLDEDQRTLFDQGLARLVGHGGAGGRGGGMMGRGAGRGMRPGMGQHPMMGQGPVGCPFGGGHGPMGGPVDVEDDD
jgi:Spy/CpxP family protein refolding chaperone